jgi:hypothetical protein
MQIRIEGLTDFVGFYEAELLFLVQFIARYDSGGAADVMCWSRPPAPHVWL